MDQATMDLILKAQRAEITEYYIYQRLAGFTSDQGNRDILTQISRDEKNHHDLLKDHTGREMQPKRWKIWLYTLLARVLGLTFAIRLMEAGEDLAQDTYQEISRVIPEISQIEEDEYDHEDQLIEMLSEQSLQYASSIVLGLNDALVELTGAIAGLTLALQDTTLIAVAGLITGISAALSMGGSEYLSTRTEDEPVKHPVKASIYTGSAYLFAVIFLVLPFFVLTNPFWALAWTMLDAFLIILAFTFYISVAKNYSFRRRFGEMVLISFGVAAVSFLIGLVVRQALGVEA